MAVKADSVTGVSPFRTDSSYACAGFPVDEPGDQTEPSVARGLRILWFVRSTTSTLFRSWWPGACSPTSWRCTGR